jgi:YVTN family beta-propeller protein
MSCRMGFLLALSACLAALPSTAQTLVADIPLSASRSGIAVNPANNRIYVSPNSLSGNSVAVINSSTNTVIDTVATSQAGRFARSVLLPLCGLPRLAFLRAQKQPFYLMSIPTHATSVCLEVVRSTPQE